MRKKSLLFITVFVSVLLILAACGSPSPLEGRWVLLARSGPEGMSYEFRPGGDGVVLRNAGAGTVETPLTWSVSEDRLELLFDGQPTPVVYYFEILDEDTIALRREGWSPESALRFGREWISPHER
ncbi:MAG: hypothetical protein FWC76_07220 [Defluviitaleaceae bacterium]|nr:hypothetical protein [Defluviitaleaceae bacterium]